MSREKQTISPAAFRCIPEEPLQGDVASPDEDWHLEFDEYDDRTEEEILSYEDNKGAIKKLCGNCSRYDTITATEKGVKCSCLSECFFKSMLKKGQCSLKNAVKPDNDAHCL